MFLTGILISAIRFGLFPSLFACGLSVLAYNFFFLPPIYTFTIADPENVVALFFFLIVAGDREQCRQRSARQSIGDGAVARPHQRGIVRLQPQARGDRLARRSALGDGLSDRAYAEIARRHPDAVGRTARLEVKAGYPPEDQLDEA